MSERNLSDYLSLPYPVVLTPDEDGEGYNAAIRELKGCMAFGETVAEAYAELQEVKRVWLETAPARGWRIPEPSSVEAKAYSGEFRVRLPSYLHRDLACLAEAEGTSLNQLVVALLSEGAERLRLGVRSGAGVPTTAVYAPSGLTPRRSSAAASPAASESRGEYAAGDSDRPNTDGTLEPDR